MKPAGEASLLPLLPPANERHSKLMKQHKEENENAVADLVAAFLSLAYSVICGLRRIGSMANPRTVSHCECSGGMLN